MRISFHHANPENGNESFLLRFEGENGESPCLLVDAGDGVNLDALLEPDDRVVAICLTHAHLDHYRELTAAHRDDAPILTSPATAAMLGDVFNVADNEYDVLTTEAVTDAITPVEDWTAVAPGIEVHPVPAGHVPGAVGFLIRVADGDRSHHLLATGDFTRRRASGFPGFDADGFVDIDVLFLTASTRDSFETQLTTGLGTALEHAHGGARTLVATSGLVGVQIAYLLSALSEKYDLRTTVRVVGQVAKLYERLEYDCPGVETVPVFDDPTTCLDHGVVTIAGPEIPIDQRSSGRLFEVLRDDPSACVVQFVGSGESPVKDARCTLYDYELVNHPTRETLVEVHDAIDPTETVVVHRHKGAGGEFNDLSSVVWGSGDTDRNVLFDGTHWRLPSWMGGDTVNRDHERSVGQFVGNELINSFSVPSIDRLPEPDLEAEGIDFQVIERLLHRGPDAATSRDAPAQPVEARSDEPTFTPTAPTMTSNGTDSNKRDETTDDAPKLTGLVPTTGADLGGELDPALQAALEEGLLTDEDLAAVREASERATEQPPENDAEDDESDEGAGPDESANTESETTANEAVVDEGVVNNEPEGAEETATDPNKIAADTETTADAEPSDELADDDSREREGDESSVTTGNESPEVETTVAATNGRETNATNESESGPTTAGSRPLELNPLAVALAEQTVERGAGGNGTYESVDAFVVEAVSEYVLALLAGDASGRDDEQFVVDVAGTSAVNDALKTIVAADDRFDSTAALVADGIASVLGSEMLEAREIDGLETYRRHLDAVVQNESYAFDGREAVVEAAVAWFSTRD